ncbi:MAG: hypothetical protein WA840_11720 [Caulobacteraceae bacterium]
MLKDRANPLRPGGPHPDPLETSVACGRCGKIVEARTMLLWSEQRRLKLPAAEPGGFRYEHRDHHHAVCPSCYGKLAEGGEVAELKRRRGVMILLAALIVGAMVLVATPFIMPELLAAFWQTGATGR